MAAGLGGTNVYDSLLPGSLLLISGAGGSSPSDQAICLPSAWGAKTPEQL